MFARKRDTQAVELQLGPMIDIVFLLLVFFMVTAKPIKPEAEVGIALPGTVELDQAPELPTEVKIFIQPGGQVVVNDLPLDAPNARRMPQLLRLLNRFRESLEASKIEPMVTIHADNGASHQRAVDVLNACAEAGLRNVTFSPDEEAGS